MSPRERFLTTLNGHLPDRPPVFATFTPQAAQKISLALKIPYEEPLDSLLSTRISHMAMLTELGNDAIGIAACTPAARPTYTDENGIIINEWGMHFRTVGLYNEFAAFPLAGIKEKRDLDAYPFPDPRAEGRFDQAVLAINKFGQGFGVIADLECTIFETAWYLVGLEKLLTDMMYNESYVQPLLDKILEINLVTGEKLIRLGADMIWAGDDFGGQQGLIMSPEIWRNLFKPRIKYLFEHFKKVNPAIKIAWHSCGSIRPIIPDFIEIGLDVLNPIQPLAHQMDAQRLKAEFGNDLIFFGGIDIQELIPNGTPAQIREDIQSKIEILGKNGGYIIAPAHNIQDDTPVENILAFFDAIRTYAA
jgi:uroporphyrinogen decarboxylase